MVATMPGAEPWETEGSGELADIGVLVVHGFTGNPQSMRPLAEAFAGAGFTVSLPLLPGHGTQVEDMLPTRWTDWSAAAEDAYDRLAARTRAVVVAGLSMGGTLAAWLATRHPEIAGLVLVNPLIDGTAPRGHPDGRAAPERRCRAGARHRLGHREGGLGRVGLSDDAGAAATRPARRAGAAGR